MAGGYLSLMKVAIIGPVCKDETVIGSRHIEHIGGIVYYTGKALHSLGIDVTLFASHSKEDIAWAEENLKGLKVKHIDAEGTLYIWHAYADDNPNHRMLNRTTYYNNEITMKKLDDMGGFDIIILAPLFHDNTPPELFKELSKTGAKIVHGNFGMFTYVENKEHIQKNPENLLEVLPFIDSLFLDDKETMFVAGKDTVEQAADYLLSKGLKNLIVTLGSEGSIIFSDNNVVKIPAFRPKELVDPTGAGDTYLAGFIKAKELFDNQLEQGKFAAMTATMGIEKVGAFDETAEHVLARLKDVPVR
jgi:sugar/nucleoside kinase (ribokinase family)